MQYWGRWGDVIGFSYFSWNSSWAFRTSSCIGLLLWWRNFGVLPFYVLSEFRVSTLLALEGHPKCKVLGRRQWAAGSKASLLVWSHWAAMCIGQSCLFMTPPAPLEKRWKFMTSEEDSGQERRDHELVIPPRPQVPFWLLRSLSSLISLLPALLSSFVKSL